MDNRNALHQQLKDSSLQKLIRHYARLQNDIFEEKGRKEEKQMIEEEVCKTSEQLFAVKRNKDMKGLLWSWLFPND